LFVDVVCHEPTTGPSSSLRCTHCSGVPHAIMRGYDRDGRGCGLQCGWCVTLLGLVSTIFAVVYAVLPGLRGSAYSESMCTVVDVEAAEFFYCRCASYCRTATRCAWSHPSPLATHARARTHTHTQAHQVIAVHCCSADARAFVCMCMYVHAFVCARVRVLEAQAHVRACDTFPPAKRTCTPSVTSFHSLCTGKSFLSHAQHAGRRVWKST